MSSFQKFALVLTGDGHETLKVYRVASKLLEQYKFTVKEQYDDEFLIVTEDEEIGWYDDIIEEIVNVLEDYEEEYMLINFVNHKHHMWPEITTYGRFYNNRFDLGTRVSFKYFAHGDNHVRYA